MIRPLHSSPPIYLLERDGSVLFIGALPRHATLSRGVCVVCTPNFNILFPARPLLILRGHQRHALCVLYVALCGIIFRPFGLGLQFPRLKKAKTGNGK